MRIEEPDRIVVVERDLVGRFERPSLIFLLMIGSLEEASGPDGLGEPGEEGRYFTRIPGTIQRNTITTVWRNTISSLEKFDGKFRTELCSAILAG